VTGDIDTPLVRVIAGRSFASRREVIDAIGDVLVASSSVTPAYVEGMHRKEEQGGTIVTAEVALPHGTGDVKQAVLRNAIVVVPIPRGVEWAGGKRVRLVIGFAGVGDRAHLRLIAALARALSDDGLVSRLKAATDAREVSVLLEPVLPLSVEGSAP
jgi:PTS system mannitol-specific IIC component